MNAKNQKLENEAKKYIIVIASFMMLTIISVGILVYKFGVVNLM